MEALTKEIDMGTKQQRLIESTEVIMNTKLQQAMNELKTKDEFSHQILTNFTFKVDTEGETTIMNYGRVLGKTVTYNPDKVNNLEMELLVEALQRIALTRAKEAIEDL